MNDLLKIEMISKFNWAQFHKDLDIALATYLTVVERGSIHDEIIELLEFSHTKSQEGGTSK